MKRIVSILTMVLILLPPVKSQIQLDCSGNVAIGNISPDSYKLRIQGLAKITTGASATIIFDNSGYSGSPAIYGGSSIGKSNIGFYEMYSYYYKNPSDLRLKENISPLANSLALISQLNGVKFDYTRASFANNPIMAEGISEEGLDSARKNFAGFIAQDVEKVIPEVVSYDKNTDIYSIDYTKFTPYLVEAIKEQQIIIENLRSEVESLKLAISPKTTLKSASITGNTNSEVVNKANSLYQNTPDPFSESTKIEYFLNEDAINSMICIYDMNGKQLKCFPLYQNDYGYVIINGRDLQAGMFMYALIASGQIVDTKRMILTD